ncbi:hypothetical protein HOH87_07095 [bacterium]|jgi:hypothetical protein|nr:hypothetical protein [bacterium]
MRPQREIVLSENADHMIDRQETLKKIGRTEMYIKKIGRRMSQINGKLSEFRGDHVQDKELIDTGLKAMNLKSSNESTN